MYTWYVSCGRSHVSLSLHNARVTLHRFDNIFALRFDIVVRDVCILTTHATYLFHYDVKFKKKNDSDSLYLK